jgi:polysaccharide export outer membrane protein
MRRFSLLPAFAALLFLLGSCTGAKRAIYFHTDTPPDSMVARLDVQERGEAIIYPEDVVGINVASITFYKDGNSSQVFLDGGLPYVPTALTAGTGGVFSGGNSKNSFFVDSTGYIDYPQLGKLKLAGLTTRQAKEMIAGKLKDYLYQPTVEVRILNFRITLLGEVGIQGQFMSSIPRVTIIDAIAAAGGIPITGRRDNVKVIRDGGRVTGIVDLNSKNVFNSPFYYLKQNDIVLVEQTRVRRQDANEFLRFYLPTFSGLFATAGTIYAVILATQANNK